MLRRLVALTLVATALTWARPASAQTTAPPPAKPKASTQAAAQDNFSAYGANLAGQSKHLIGIAAGMPSFEITYRYGLTSKIDLGGRFNFYYLFPYYDVDVELGDELAFDLRAQLLQRGGFSILVKGELGLLLNYTSGFAVGLLLLQPGVLFGYNIKTVHLYGGLELPVALVMGTGNNDAVAGFIPIAFNLGAEFRVTPRLNLFFHVRVGPSIAVVTVEDAWGNHHTGDDVHAIINALFGVQIRL